VTRESHDPATDQPSLNPLRIAALVGLCVAVLLVVIGFSVSLLLGVIAIIVSPVVPLAFVLATDRLRRR
jgi:Flp pilus assembly protein TadB